MKINRIFGVALAFTLALDIGQAQLARIPDKTVILTFDDAVKSQFTVVVPLLEHYGFKATFYITHAWMEDKEHFMSWEDAADLNRKGFEIGNHTWTHNVFDKPRENAAKLEHCWGGTAAGRRSTRESGST